MTHKLSIFETLKNTTQNKKEYWLARELVSILNYSEYRHADLVIKKAKESCKNAGQSVKNHFEEVLEMVKLGSMASRRVKDIYLSRYACYLIMQNADPSKEIVALGQTYFAIQTRKQEIQDQRIEDHKRLDLRKEVTIHNKQLAQTARKAGVRNFASFTNYGYRGL